MPDALPLTIESEAALEDLLTRPNAADVEFAKTLTSDVMVLGAGGKMGPSLARRVRHALAAAGSRLRVLAVSRFSDRAVASDLEKDGIEVITSDVLDPEQVARLPSAGNVLYLA